MLVIRRRLNESIRIGDSVDIIVLEITPSRIKLGIEAPADVEVTRKELRLAREQNRAASVFDPAVLSNRVFP